MNTPLTRTLWVVYDFKDLGFRCQIHRKDYADGTPGLAVEFEIYEVLADPEDVDFDPIARGTVKWDGCSDFNIGDEHALAHACGREFNIFRAVERAWDLAQAYMPDADRKSEIEYRAQGREEWFERPTDDAAVPMPVPSPLTPIQTIRSVTRPEIIVVDDK